MPLADPARFARLALDAAAAVLPERRTKFSKRLFTQRQFVAILCLRDRQGWSLRETHAHLLREPGLRAALDLTQAPHYTAIHRFQRRVAVDLLEGACAEAARRVAQLDDAGQRAGTDAAPPPLEPAVDERPVYTRRRA